MAGSWEEEWDLSEVQEPQFVKYLSPTTHEADSLTLQEEEWDLSEVEELQFIKYLSPTTHEADSLTSTNQMDFDKIYLLGRHYGSIVYYLYNIDLSSACKDICNSIRSLKPILRIFQSYDRIRYHSYVVVGSKLFMIGGYDFAKGWIGIISWYDFSGVTHYDRTIRVKEKYLTTGPPMEGRKCEPNAVVFGGNKICVFGSLLYYKVKAEYEDDDDVEDDSFFEPPNFEVFDTQLMSWTKLPEIASDYSTYKMNAICIKSYCLERSWLIVCTDIGIYGIKLDVDHPYWVEMGWSEKIVRSPSLKRLVTVGEKLCSPFEVAGLGEVNSLPPVNYEGILCKEIVDNEVILCSVLGQVEFGTSVLVLTVKVVKLDSKLLEKSGGDMRKSIQSVRSSIFEVESRGCEDFTMLGCWFQSKETEESEDEQIRESIIFLFKETEPALENNALEERAVENNALGDNKVERESTQFREMQKSEAENNQAVETNALEDKKFDKNSTQLKETEKSEDEETEKNEDENDPALEEKKFERNSTQFKECNELEKSEDENDPAVEDNKDEKNSSQFKEAEKVGDGRRSKMVDSVVVLGSLIYMLLYAAIC